MFSAVEMLRIQFSRAIDQTFEHFLDAWSPPANREDLLLQGYSENQENSTEIPVISSM